MTTRRRVTGALLGAVAITAASCGSSTSDPISPDGTRTFTMVVAPITVAAGTEQTNCVTLRLTNSGTMLVRRLQLLSDAGVAQVIVYRSSASTEVPSPGVTCAPFDGLGSGHPLFMANQPSASLTFPVDPAGNPVGPVIEAGEMLEVEVHLLNATAASLAAGTKLIVDAIPLPATTVASDMAVFTTVTLSTPPGANVLHSLYQASLPGTRVFALNTQQWRFGTDVRVYRASSASDRSEALLDDTDWSKPPIHAFSPALDMTGKGFITDCTTYNTSLSTLTFGTSALNNDACFLWQYYYPAAGFQFCVDGSCSLTP